MPQIESRAAARKLLSDHTAPAPRNQSRLERLAEKQNVRRQATEVAAELPFSELSLDPRFQLLSRAVCPPDLRAELEALGVETAAAAARHGSAEGLSRALQGAGRAAPEGRVLMPLFRRAQAEAQRAYRLYQARRAFADPVNLGLRHGGRTLALAEEQAKSAAAPLYAAPNSIQSEQSPAAYLRYLYRIATGVNKDIGIIPSSVAGYPLTSRRPDLAELVLSEANLKDEIPLVALTNEVLAAGMREGVDMARMFNPIALPFDAEAEEVRATLGALEGQTLNDIARALQPQPDPARGTARRAWDVTGLLGLTGRVGQRADAGSEVALVKGPAPDVPTLGGLIIDGITIEQAYTTVLSWQLGCEFDELVQLFGLYTVYAEDGSTVPQQAYATAFLGNTTDFVLGTNGASTWVTIGDDGLRLRDWRSAHIAVRLARGSGLEFHALNWLLALPGASVAGAADAPEAGAAHRYVTPEGLRLLAGHRLMASEFGLSAHEYAALFGPVCAFRRGDVVTGGEGETEGLETTETSLLHQVFGDTAPEVYRLITAAGTPITDPALAKLIARGFGLSLEAMEVLGAALTPGFQLDTGVDAAGLGGLFRVARLFELLGWPVPAGVALCQAVGGGLWTGLAKRVVDAASLTEVIEAIDHLLALAEWMSARELAPGTLAALLTPDAGNRLLLTPEEAAALDLLGQQVQPSLVAEARFLGFTTWAEGATLDPAALAAALCAGPHQIATEAGVFLPGLTPEAMRAALAGAVAETGGFDPEAPDANSEDKAPGNDAHFARLVQAVEALWRDQGRACLTTLSGLTRMGLGAVTPLITWTGGDPHGLLAGFLHGADNPEALRWLAEINRYAATAAALDLGEIDLWMVTEKPEWLDAALAGQGALSLSQLIGLAGFTGLQLGAASDAAWRGYLALANEGAPGSDEGPEALAYWRRMCHETVAAFLQTTAEEVAEFLGLLVAPEAVARDVATLVRLSAHIRLAAKLGLKPEALLALAAVAPSEASGDWAAAAAAADIAVHQSQGGARVTAARNRLAEVKRDALVAAYLATSQNIAGDAEGLSQALLLDLQVTSDVPTSRIVEAISSLQSYITRALNGLEPRVDFYDRAALLRQWQLDKEYRSWEANQKLRLYPQNYIEPDLRIITSPEFDTFQQTIGGGDLSPDTVEKAVNDYMAALARRCDLRLCSLSVDSTNTSQTPGQSTYHLLAKAQWETGQFFYRKLEADFATIQTLEDPTQFRKALDWTFWQPVTISKTFEFLSDVTVCFFRNRYFFFWLEVERLEENSDAGKSVSWKIHPKYMRCDANSLVGTIQTPGVFTGNATEFPAENGALVCKGARPVLSGTYQPTTITEPMQYGSLTPAERQGTDATAMVVTFGLDLNGAEATLQIRLTEEWADAILDTQTGMINHHKDSAPAAYLPLYPRPAYVVTHLDERSFPASGVLDLSYSFTRPNEFFKNTHPSGRASVCRFLPNFKDSTSIGSVRYDLSLGARVYVWDSEEVQSTISESPNTAYSETGPVGVRSRVTFEFTLPGKPSETFVSDWRTHPQQAFSVRLGAPTSATHVPDERLTADVPLPADWTFDAARKAHVQVSLEVERKDPKVNVEYSYSEYYYDPYTGKTYYFPAWATYDANAQTATRKESFALAAFDIEPATVIADTGWTLGTAHGSRTFLHLIPYQFAPLDQSYLVFNASSAMAELARLAPRPGGCEGLFTYENQSFAERLGGFPEAFEQTLRKIYPGEVPQDTSQAVMNPVFTPRNVFDFDGAYGGYGWEVFYHMPTAIAASYTASGAHDAARKWLAKIYNPGSDRPWGVVPLDRASAAPDELVFVSGEVINDPDRIAQDYPYYYRQATLRHTLEAMIAAADEAYAEETREALVQAKGIYVEAQDFFEDTLRDLLQTVTNTPWQNPSLGEVAADGAAHFLPPVNGEMLELYDLIEERLTNLRAWRTMDGQPLDVALLSPPIDPAELQQAAKSAQSLTTAATDAEDAREPVFDFLTVARSAKGYIANLSTTSSRLQASMEKLDSNRLSALSLEIGHNKALRSAALYTLKREASDLDVAVKEAQVAGASTILGNHVAKIMVVYGSAYAAYLARKVYSVGFVIVSKIASGVSMAVAGATSGIPTIIGMANGGANISMPSLAQLQKLTIEAQNENLLSDIQKDIDKNTKDLAEVHAKLLDYSAAVAKARADLDLSKKQRAIVEAEEQNANADATEAQKMIARFDDNFSGIAFYEWMIADLEQLFSEQWATTQDFCNLLVRVYAEETGLSDGPSFFKTSLGAPGQWFNAPHWLALEVERLEAAYIRKRLDDEGQATRLAFDLGTMTAEGTDLTVPEALIETGEAYFTLTDEMFDAVYPGQFDRRIQSVRMCFEGLATARLSPHARLVQLRNTRWLTAERDRTRGGRARVDSHPLQSVMLPGPDVDTGGFARPEGRLRLFQNTGVASQWHLSVPMLAAGPRSTAATLHAQALREHLSGLRFEVAFCGRWAGM